MPNANVTVTVEASQVTALINNLQRVVQLEQQASRTITVNINTSQIDSAAQSMERMSTAAQNIATVMRGLGSASGALGNFASGIGNSFSQMSSLFGNNNVSTALTRFLTYNVLRGVTSNISNIVSRYDIMSTFIPYMNVAGVDANTANTALSRVNESILGLPIGLDEAAQRLRRYQMFLGDVEDATNLTIGLQSAILAGGASDQMKTTAYYQVDRLLSAGRLNQSRQWLALIQGLGVSMKFLTEQMGVEGMEVKDLAAGLASGAISTETFLNALMELGKGESSAAQGLQSTLDIYKSTIEAWVSNIQYAFARGGENVMRAFNETLIDVSGQGITGFMKNYRDFLNEAFLGTSDWIRNNPQMLMNLLGEGTNLIDAISRFSASEFAQEAGTNIGRLFSGISTALSAIPDGKLEEFAAFATTLAGPLGTMMGASSGLGQLIGVFERFKDFNFDMLIGDVTGQIGNMANVIEALLNVVGDERMSDLLAFGLVWGQPISSVLSTGANVLTSASLAKLAFGGTGAGIMTGAGIGAGLFGTTLLTALGIANYTRTQDIEAQLGLQGSNTLFAQSAIHAAENNLLSWQNAPIASAEEAQSRAQQIQTSLTMLNSEILNQTTRLENAQETAAKAYAEYYRIQEAMNNGGELTAEDINNFNSYWDTAKNAEATAAQIKANMAGLNQTYLDQALYLNDLRNEWGLYDDSLSNASDSMVRAEEVMSEYEQHLMDLKQTYQEVRQSAEESFLKQLQGFEQLEMAETPEGGFISEDTEGLESQNEIMTSVIENLGKIQTYIDELAPEDQEGVDLAGYVHDILGLGDLEEVAPRLQEVVKALGEDGGLTSVLESFSQNQSLQEQLSTAMSNFGASIDTFLDSAGKAATAAEQMKTAMDNVPAAWEESFNSVKETLEQAAGEIPEAAQEVADGLQPPMEEMTSTAEENSEATVSAVETIAPGVEAQQGPVQSATEGIGTAIHVGMTAAASEATAGAAEVIAAIQAAAAQIQAAAGTISINIPVTYSTSGSTSGAYSSDGSMSIEVAEALGWATGGSIFSPIGSDIVPAMLTPGEYIIRKGAVDFFGKGLMDRINSLDIGGAFDRLMLSPPMMSRFGGNVYNRDSHNNVTQNVYTNNPNFANKRAWRFAL